MLWYWWDIIMELIYLLKFKNFRVEICFHCCLKCPSSCGSSPTKDIMWRASKNCFQNFCNWRRLLNLLSLVQYDYRFWIFSFSFPPFFLLIVFFVTFILNFLLALVIFVINSREAIADAIFVRLLFFFSYFVVQIFDTTIWRQNHFKSAFCSVFHAISTELRAWLHLSLLLERVFCWFVWLNFWSDKTYLTPKNDFLTLKLTFFFLNSKS